jgi:hypothetical protein
VGAENRLGSRGQDTYLNGVGTLPSNGTELRVSSTGCAIVSCDVTIDAGATPAGYLPLSLFGVLPVAGVLDDNVINFSVPPFAFGAETYSTLGFSSNGYAIVGGSIGPIDNTYFNQNLPDVSRPNGTLAPFWTDLNPFVAGELRIATLTDGADTWIVLDWANVREYSTPNSNSFEIWIGILADANPGEDISYAYGPIGGSGNGGFLTVGAENRFGTRGQNAYFDGIGDLPENGTQLRVRMVSCKLIFSSGFEPGNVLAWSASAP